MRDWRNWSRMTGRWSMCYRGAVCGAAVHGTLRTASPYGEFTAYAWRRGRACLCPCAEAQHGSRALRGIFGVMYGRRGVALDRPQCAGRPVCIPYISITAICMA